MLDLPVPLQPQAGLGGPLVSPAGRRDSQPHPHPPRALLRDPQAEAVLPGLTSAGGRALELWCVPRQGSLPMQSTRKTLPPSPHLSDCTDALLILNSARRKRGLSSALRTPNSVGAKGQAAGPAGRVPVLRGVMGVG